MTMQADTPVGQIATEYPMATKVFARHGMDFCCGGGQAIQKVCESKGLDVAAVLDEIGEAVADPDTDMERWDEASAAVNAALDKGGFSDRKTGDAYVLQGMSEFNLGNYNKASTAWGRASKYPRAKKSAEQWMNHMREERARRS